MWRRKKFFLPVLIASAVVAGSLGGVAFAQTGNGDGGEAGAQPGALLDRVCEIYEENTGTAIDQEVLKDAFTQAQSEMREAALENRLQYMVEEGKMTQEQADNFKAWLESRPDTDDFKAWMESRPDDLPGFGLKGHCGFPGMGRMHGFGGSPCVLAE